MNGNSDALSAATVQSQQSFNFCALAEQKGSLQVVSDANSWQAWQAQLNRTSPSTQITIQPNFERDRVVLVSLGSKPSAGYGVLIKALQFETDLITVDVKQVKPTSGSMNALIVTSPCVVAIIANRSIEKIRARDIDTQQILFSN